MTFCIRLHLCIGNFSNFPNPLLVIDYAIFNFHGISAGRRCCQRAQNAADERRLYVSIQKSTAGPAIGDKSFHKGAHIMRCRRKRSFRTPVKDGNGALRTDRQTMLTLPTAPPPKALKRLHFWEAVLAEFNHHAGACIDTRSALDAFVSVHFKIRPAFRWQESPQAPFGIYSRASALKDPSSPEDAFIQNAKKLCRP